MLTVQKIADYCEEKIPAELALSFDNVGLLCGFPEREVSRVLVALDVTMELIGEAKEFGVQLIVTHHPVIFTPMKQILSSEPEGRRIIALLESRLSVLSLHTNLDIADGGVNCALAAALGLENAALLDIGRMGTLSEAVPLKDFLQSTQRALNVSGMRYLDSGRPVQQVAVCGGSGGDMVGEAAAAGCDTLVTGEIRHHQWLDGRELGINLIEADHFCTENVVVPVLAELLQTGFPTLEVFTSTRQKQPSRGF